MLKTKGLYPFKKSRSISPRALLLFLMLFLSGCQTTISSCPAYPKAGKKVAAELQVACFTQDTDETLCPNTFEWLDRIGKLKDQLDACR